MKKIFSLILMVALVASVAIGYTILFDNFCIVEEVHISDTNMSEKVYYIDLEPTEVQAETETTREIIHVESLELDRYEVKIKVGESQMPMVTMLPENAEDKSELWSSSDTSVATVNSYGNITGVSAGTCTVTVRSADNQELHQSVEVIVEETPKGSNDDIELLAHLITNEAAGCDDRTQQLVASVVINRMASQEPDFAGKSMSEIIHAPGQYDLTSNFDKPYTDRAYKNAKYIIEHGPICPSSVIFQSEYATNGSSIWKKILCPNGHTMYFAYANNMSYYN